jgi:excisionase family DNA binding protein
MGASFVKPEREMWDLLTIPEVAARLRMSRWTAYSLVKAGELRAIRIRSRVLVRSDELDDFVRQAERPAPRPALSA